VRAAAYREDGTRRRPSDRVRYGETIFIIRPPFEEPDAPQDFGVLYEDEDLLAVDKPAGLPVHPSASYHRNTLTQLLRDRYGRPTPQIAHRLDKETSGVLVCGKTPEAERALKRAFEDRRVDKTYQAIVRGELERDEGRIDAAMARPEQGFHLLMEVRSEEEGGLPAITDYRVLGRRGGLSLVELYPISGRQHQLRVHLAHLGHPIVGDKLYGPEGHGLFFEVLERGMTPDLLTRLGLERQALHASALTVPHPKSGRMITIRAKLPDDMQNLWENGLPSCSTESEVSSP